MMICDYLPKLYGNSSRARVDTQWIFPNTAIKQEVKRNLTKWKKKKFSSSSFGGWSGLDSGGTKLENVEMLPAWKYSTATRCRVSRYESSNIHHDGGVAVDEEGFFSKEKRKNVGPGRCCCWSDAWEQRQENWWWLFSPPFEPQPEDVCRWREKERKAETRTAVSLTTRFGENVSRLYVVVVRSWLLCQLELIVGEPKLFHMCVRASASQHEPKSRSRREENPRKISWKKYFNELTISCCWSSRLYKTNSLTRVGLN